MAVPHPTILPIYPISFVRVTPVVTQISPLLTIKGQTRGSAPYNITDIPNIIRKGNPPWLPKYHHY